MKNKFAVIGHPVAHSLSPAMHSANFAAIGYDAQYSRLDVDPSDLEPSIQGLRAEGFTGINITVPHKIAVIPILDKADESVQRYGACNTIKFENDGTISGYNTDVIGFVECLSAHGFSLSGKKVVILGSGGAGSALARCACYEGAAEVKIAARRIEAGAALTASLAESGFSNASVIIPADGILSPENIAKAWISVARGADLIVNATPLGLNPNDPPALPEETFLSGQFVLDIIPTRSFPPTAAAAARAGATAIDGIEFLVGQGAASFKIWTGLDADKNAMLSALRP